MAGGLDPAAPFGPYVPPEGGTLECTVIVKAAPERSKKHGETVCTAALLDDGRLIRLYPVPIDEYWRKDIPKYTRVAVRVTPSDERASRPESHKIEGGLMPTASPLRAGTRTPWEARMRLLRRAMRPGGMRGLRDLQAKHGTSLGIVKVRELRDFYITAPLNEIIEQADFRQSAQTTLTGQPIMEGSRIDKLKHVFRYTWKCEGACCDDDAPGRGYHDTTCEDWELFESFRRWRGRYRDDADLVDALKNKFYDCMGQSDLHFAMGTPSDPKMQDSWMIVGLIYPGIPRRPRRLRKTLIAGSANARQMVRPDSTLDRVATRDIRLAESENRPKGLDRWG